MFTKQEVGFLQDVFALARVETVTSDPKNRQQLENIMNFEAIFGGKIIKANEALGFVEEEAPSDIPQVAVEDASEHEGSPA
jgi:hypothetical protein